MSLIIADGEFSRGASRINDISQELLDIFTSFGQAVEVLTSQGICDVSVNNVLAEKVATLNTYAVTLTDIADNIVNYTNEFITDIDEADKYLYDV